MKRKICFFKPQIMKICFLEIMWTSIEVAYNTLFFFTESLFHILWQQPRRNKCVNLQGRHNTRIKQSITVNHSQFGTSLSSLDTKTDIYFKFLTKVAVVSPPPKKLLSVFSHSAFPTVKQIPSYKIILTNSKNNDTSDQFQHKATSGTSYKCSAKRGGWPCIHLANTTL